MSLTWVVSRAWRASVPDSSAHLQRGFTSSSAPPLRTVAFVEGAALASALRERPALRHALALGRLAPALQRAAQARFGDGPSLLSADVAVYGVDEGATTPRGAGAALLRQCGRAGLSPRGFSVAHDPPGLAAFAAGVALGADVVAAASGEPAADVIIALVGGPAFMAPLVRAAQRGRRVLLVTRFTADFARAWRERPAAFRGPGGVEAAALEDVMRDLAAEEPRRAQAAGAAAALDSHAAAGSSSWAGQDGEGVMIALDAAADVADVAVRHLAARTPVRLHDARAGALGSDGAGAADDAADDGGVEAMLDAASLAVGEAATAAGAAVDAAADALFGGGGQQ